MTSFYTNPDGAQSGDPYSSAAPLYYTPGAPISSGYSAPTTSPGIPSGVGYGAAALGVLGATGLLGGGGTVTNPYSGQANGNYTNAGDAAGDASGAGRTLANTGESALGEYNDFAPTEMGTTSDALRYLSESPYDDTYDQAQLSKATQGNIIAGGSAKMNLAEALGARGVLSPGGASSEYAGGVAGIDAANAGTLAQGQNNVALSAIAQRRQNLMDAHQLAADQASSLFSRGAQGTQGGASALTSAGGLYDTTGNDWLNEGQEQIQNTQNSNNASAAGWAGLANVGMQIAGV